MNGLLSLLIFLPVVGTLVVLFVPREKSSVIKWVTTLFAGAEFLLSIPLWTFAGFRKSGDFFFRETHDWIPSLGAKYSLGVDGIAALLILLTTLLSFISVYASFSAITKREKEYYAFLLLLETGMIGVFVRARLLPLLRVLGSDARPDVLPDRHLGRAAQALRRDQVLPVHARGLGRHAARDHRALLLQHVRLPVVKGLGNAPTFDIVHFQAIASSIPGDLQLWLFWAFFIGFAIKVPMFPFHTWLPDAHVEAPTAGSVILAGVLLKMGTYGFLRFSLPLCPDALYSNARFLGLTTVGWVAALSIVGIVYGSMVAMVQKDMKKLVAYSSVAHLGFVMLGLFALNNAGIQGGDPAVHQPRHSRPAGSSSSSGSSTRGRTPA